MIRREYASQPQLLTRMNELAKFLDMQFNGDLGMDRKWIFALFVMPIGQDKGQVNYVTNHTEGDMMSVLKEFVAKADRD